MLSAARSKPPWPGRPKRKFRKVRRAAELELEDVERAVLGAIEATAGSLPAAAGASIDDVVDTTGLAASQVLATLGVLEMRRIVRRLRR